MPLNRCLRRTLFLGAGLLLLLVLLGAGLYTRYSRTFYPEPPEANYPPTGDPRTAQLQDLEYFEHYLALNRSYTAEGLAEARELLTSSREEAGTLTPAEFDLTIARLTALADNGHSRVYIAALSRRHNRIPCRLYRFADGYYVVRARGACAPLLGGRVLALNGRGIEGVVDRLFIYAGGRREHFDQYASPFFLESPALLQAANEGSDPERITLRVLRADGSQLEVEVEGEPADPQRGGGTGVELLSPEPIAQEGAGWISILSTDTEIPSFLQEIAVPFRSIHLAEEGVYLVQLRSNRDEEGYPIAPFLDRVRREVRAANPRAIVLDLRLDQGGDFTKTVSLMKDLTRLAPGVERAFVLTSAWTFSAGISSVALAKEHGGDRVTIVGEPVGDRLRSWGEGGTLTLPHSRLSLGFATGLHDYTTPCFGEKGCYWMTFFYPMHVASVEPEIRVDYTFADYLALRDPALERVLEELRLAPRAN